MTIEPLSTTPIDEEQKPTQTPMPSPGAQSGGLVPLSTTPIDEGPSTRDVLRAAVTINPQDAADVERLSKRYPGPNSVLLRNLKDIRMVEAVDKYDEILKTSPKLAEHMRSSALAAAQGKDSAVHLAKIESGISDIGWASIDQATLGLSKSIFLIPDAAQRAIGSVADVVEMTGLPRNLNPVRGPQDLLRFLSEGRIPGVGTLKGGGTNQMAESIGYAQELLTNNPGTFNPAFKDLSTIGKNSDVAFKAALSGDAKPLATVLSSPEYWVAAVGQAAPSLLTAYYSGGSLAFMGMMEGLEQASSAADFEKRTGKKISDAEFTTAFMQTALVNAWLERYGLDKVLGARGKGVTGVLKALTAEGGTEGLQQISSNLATFLNYDKTQSLSEGVLSSVMGGAGSGGGAASLHASGQYAAEKIVQANEANQRAELSANNLADLMAKATATPLREANPEAFRSAVEAMAAREDGTQTSFFVDAEVLAQSGIDFTSVMPAIAEQMNDALASGSTVEVALADALTVAPGTPLEQLFAQNARETPNSPSLADSQAASEKAGEFIRMDAERVLQEASDTQAARDSYDRVRADVFAKLTAGNEFSAAENTKYAALTADFYTTLGSYYNVNAEEMMRRRTLQVATRKADAASALDKDSAALLQGLGKDTHVASLGKVAPTLRNLYKAAGKAKPSFDRVMTRIAQVVDGGVKLPSLKKTGRTVEKIKLDYAGDPTRIKDLVRGTVEVRRVASAQQAVKQIMLAMNVLPTGQRNLLDEKVDPADGYRDAKFNVDLGNGVIGEVQINIPGMLAAKKIAHALYEERRTLEGLLHKEGRLPTAQEEATIADLNAKMKAIYAPAWAEALATSAEKSSSEMGAPLRRADSGSNGLGGETSQAAQYAGQPGTTPNETGTPSTSKNSAISSTSDPIIGDPAAASKADLSDFTRSRIPGILGMDSWAILTAEDPGAQKATPEQNAARTAELEADLKELGADYMPVVGKYGDVQGSLIVTNITEEAAAALGRKYGQESILTREGLVYMDGRLVPATGVEVFDTPPEDFYTYIPETDTYFSVGLDFDGAGSVLNQRMSTRVPSAVSSGDAHLDSFLGVGLEAIKDDVPFLTKLATKFDDISSLRTRRMTDPLARLEAYIEQMKDNLLWLHDQVPQDIRERSRLWYDGARNIAERWTEKHGGKYSDMQMSGVLAVMSPQMDWFQNVTLAERIVDIYTAQQNTPWTEAMTAAIMKTAAGKKPQVLAQITGKTLAEVADADLQAYWIAAYDLAYNSRDFHVVTPEGDFADLSRNLDGSPMKGSWANGFSPIAKAVSILQDGSVQNVSAQLGLKHKVRSFYNNIFDPLDPSGSVTADTHAVAAALLSILVED